MATLISRLGRTLLSGPTRRSLSTTSRVWNATPEWEQLVGGRQGTERQRQRFQAKYLEALERKAQREGVTVEELQKRTAASLLAEQEQARNTKLAAEATSISASTPVSTTATPSTKSSKVKSAPVKSTSKSPIKPLNDIMDLSKAATLNSTAVSQLWTTYHQAKGYLSAAVPVETYERMVKLAKRYPLFVLPLARDVSVGEIEADKATATEMYLMEWALLPPPTTAHTPVPSPSTVLFTPLAEYKVRQAYAQPYLILTHYSDLAESHKVVLMRGEITTNVALDPTAAQILTVRMQLFYNNSLEGKGPKDTDVDRERLKVLKTFHEIPDEFDVEALIRLAEISEL
ncbi:BQ2448_1254 [Microbotryum intermedium]|uniref:BQ2448_1254 protein n=1 Tax=Microbotryum intermedium TaxID=269621 RepID=A0A238F7N3_9BASI|nr:BQ2448_1254 [Microbotryum intermedium]